MSDPQQIRQSHVPKAPRIPLLYEGSLPDRIPAQWREELVPVLSPEQMRRLRDTYAALGQGDVLLIASAPAGGTRVSVGDRIALTDPGHALMDAFLALRHCSAEPAEGSPNRRYLLRLLEDASGAIGRLSERRGVVRFAEGCRRRVVDGQEGELRSQGSSEPGGHPRRRHGLVTPIDGDEHSPEGQPRRFRRMVSHDLLSRQHPRDLVWRQ